MWLSYARTARMRTTLYYLSMRSPASQRGVGNSSPSGNSVMFYRLGLATVRWRLWIIAAWALVVLAALPFAPRAAEALAPGGFGSPDMESQQAVTALEQGLHTSFTSVLVIFS